ncbi:MAG: DUF4332 domain-containing protein [Cyanobacteria bacterium P01_H01_bin.58]
MLLLLLTHPNTTMSFRVNVEPLGQLPGLSHEQIAQLQRLGVETTRDLLHQARSPQASQAMAKRLSIPLRYVQKWRALAELSQLPSVGCQYCGLLLHSGVASVAQLASSAPGKLHNQVRRLHTATLRRADLCPTPDQVVRWVQEAKQLPSP